MDFIGANALLKLKGGRVDKEVAVSILVRVVYAVLGNVEY